jgi:hypothetical protein
MKWNLLDGHLTPEEALQQTNFKERFLTFFLFIWVGTLFLRFSFRGFLVTSSIVTDLLGVMCLEVVLIFGALIFYNKVLFKVKDWTEIIRRTTIGAAMVAVLLLMIKAFQIAITFIVLYKTLGDPQELDGNMVNSFLYESYRLDVLWISIDCIFIFFILHVMNILKHK